MEEVPGVAFVIKTIDISAGTSVVEESIAIEVDRDAPGIWFGGHDEGAVTGGFGVCRALVSRKDRKGISANRAPVGNLSEDGCGKARRKIRSGRKISSTGGINGAGRYAFAIKGGDTREDGVVWFEKIVVTAINGVLAIVLVDG